MAKKNKFPYQIILYSGVFGDEDFSINKSFTLDHEPTDDELLGWMKENDESTGKPSPYCECYYDKRNNDEYEGFVFSVKLLEDGTLEY